MTKLYSNLATAYHAMYQGVFDYKKQFQLYHKYLKKYKCKKVLEIGCGSGNLAPFFLENEYNYLGLDLYNEMLDIAKTVAPKAKFVQGDMRDFKLNNRFDAIIISGRSFTYMTTNKDVMDTLGQVYKHLKKGGTLIFDNFNAEKMIVSKKKKHFTQTVTYNQTEYTRVSEKELFLESGWTERWNATYYITKNGKTKTIKDSTIVRSFTKDELKIFLTINNFKVLEIRYLDIDIITIAQKQ